MVTNPHGGFSTYQRDGGQGQVPSAARHCYFSNTTLACEATKGAHWRRFLLHALVGGVMNSSSVYCVNCGSRMSPMTSSSFLSARPLKFSARNVQRPKMAKIRDFDRTVCTGMLKKSLCTQKRCCLLKRPKPEAVVSSHLFIR